MQLGALTLRGDEHHYVSKVRRLNVGAQLVLLDGQGHMARAELQAMGTSTSELWVHEICELSAPNFRLHVAAALIKGERMDWAITKMVELGVDQITPLHSERSVVKLSKERAGSKHARFLSLARAAARQSQNAQPTSIAQVQRLPAWLESGPAAELKLIPSFGGQAQSLEARLQEVASIASAIVMIGPEGGFSPTEEEQAFTKGFLPVSLGPRTLRAETACIYIASVLGFRYGDVGRH